jgi:hypothetical protein
MKVLGERSENGHHAGCPLFGRTCTNIESAELNPLPAGNVTQLLFSVAKLPYTLPFGKRDPHLILLKFSLSCYPSGTQLNRDFIMFYLSFV